jgi:hypothetical protein
MIATIRADVAAMKISHNRIRTPTAFGPRLATLEVDRPAFARDS